MTIHCLSIPVQVLSYTLWCPIIGHWMTVWAWSTYAKSNLTCPLWLLDPIMKPRRYSMPIYLRFLSSRQLALIAFLPLKGNLHFLQISISRHRYRHKESAAGKMDYFWSFVDTLLCWGLYGEDLCYVPFKGCTCVVRTQVVLRLRCNGVYVAVFSHFFGYNFHFILYLLVIS